MSFHRALNRFGFEDCLIGKHTRDRSRLRSAAHPPVSGFIEATWQRVLPCSEETKNGRVAYDHPGTQFPRLDTPPSSDNEGAVSQVDDHWVLAEKPEKSRRPATAAPGILAPGKRSLTTSLKENERSVPPVARVHRATGWRGWRPNWPLKLVGVNSRFWYTKVDSMNPLTVEKPDTHID